MSTIIDDYVKTNGEWAKAKKIDGRTFQTVSGAKWFGMHHRCECKSYQEVHPNYSDVTVGFQSFDSFVNWHRLQFGYGEKDWHLDKDVLVKGNKVYSEDNCVLLPRELNSMIVWKSKNRGLPPCVTPHGTRFIASCTFERKSVYLGIRDTPEEAFFLYKTAKEVFIKQQAEKWKDKIDPRAYEALMNYQVEITD